jgi:hypothetical protein
MRASKKVMGAVLLTSASALILGAPTVHADSGADNNSGLLGGLNLLNDVQLNLPVTVGGVGVLGVGSADSHVVSTNKGAGSSSSSSSGGGSSKSSANNNHGLLGGLNVGNNLQANVPVTVCGVGALLAKGTGDCSVKATNKGGGGGSSSANGNSGLLGGVNALNNAQANVPVTVCGLAVLGDADCAAAVKSTNGGGSGSGSGVAGASSANGNSGLLGGLNLLNNLDLSVPVTVCGLAVLGSAEGSCVVEAVNTDDDGGDVAGVHRNRDHGSAVRGATLPHTGAAGLALIPFGLALVAGGVALRRRVGSEA